MGERESGRTVPPRPHRLMVGESQAARSKGGVGVDRRGGGDEESSLDGERAPRRDQIALESDPAMQHDVLRWPLRRQARPRTGSRHAATRWSVARQRKH